MQNRPKIIISNRDADRLYELLDSLPAASAAGHDELEAELDRADTVDPEAVPGDVVTMNSTVRFRVKDSDRVFELTLVYPKNVDTEGRTVSVLAPVGSALLGLRVGGEIAWPKPGGGTLQLAIDEIVYQPEREGEYHR